MSDSAHFKPLTNPPSLQHNSLARCPLVRYPSGGSKSRRWEKAVQAYAIKGPKAKARQAKRLATRARNAEAKAAAALWDADLTLFPEKGAPNARETGGERAPGTSISGK